MRVNINWINRISAQLEMNINKKQERELNINQNEVRDTSLKVNIEIKIIMNRYKNNQNKKIK